MTINSKHNTTEYINSVLIQRILGKGGQLPANLNFCLKEAFSNNPLRSPEPPAP